MRRSYGRRADPLQRARPCDGLRDHAAQGLGELGPVLQRQKSPRLVGVYHPRRFDPARDRCCCQVRAPDRQRRDVQHRNSSGSLKQRGEHRRLISDGGVEQRAGHVRYCRRSRHAIVLLKGVGNSISRCLDHGRSADIPAGILPWRPQSYSRGPTEERRREHFADGGYR